MLHGEEIPVHVWVRSVSALLVEFEQVRDSGTFLVRSDESEDRVATFEFVADRRTGFGTEPVVESVVGSL